MTEKPKTLSERFRKAEAEFKKGDTPLYRKGGIMDKLLKGNDDDRE